MDQAATPDQAPGQDRAAGQDQGLETEWGPDQCQDLPEESFQELLRKIALAE